MKGSTGAGISSRRRPGLPLAALLAGVLSLAAAGPAQAFPAAWLGQSFFPPTSLGVNRTVYLFGPAVGGPPQGFFFVSMTVTPANVPVPGPNGFWVFVATDPSGNLQGIMSGTGSGVAGTMTEQLILNPFGSLGMFSFAQGTAVLQLTSVGPLFAQGLINFPVAAFFPTFVFG